MSADLLRRAAKVLREHGEKATEGPWTSATEDPEMCAVDAPSGRALVDVLLGYSDDRENHPQAHADAEYIALMHPPVALALATSLENLAEAIDGTVGDAAAASIFEAEVALARAILREPS